MANPQANLAALMAEFQALPPLAGNATNASLRAHVNVMSQIIVAQSQRMAEADAAAAAAAAAAPAAAVPAAGAPSITSARGLAAQNYNGKTEVREWLAHMEDFFDVCRTPEEDKVKYARVHLAPKVVIQWKAKVLHLVDGQENPESWEVFKKTMTSLYGPANPSEKARRELAKLRHGRMRAETFQKLFVETAAQISENPLSENDLSGRFWDALDPELKVLMKASNQGRMPENLQSMYDLSVSLDQSLMELRKAQKAGETQGEKHYKKPKNGSFQNHNQKHSGQKRKDGESSNSGKFQFQHKKKKLSRSEQILKGTPPLSAEEKKKLQETGSCFLCKQTGHLARECPKRPKRNGNGQKKNGTPQKKGVTIEQLN
eukprot:TRINITY_DN1449_c0_g1_i1.p1 TRINITY_DN1449_c0_g1~~TRINITY_DN1449_c0_g1_i1.p1  ORF type:complete len:373 (+),score=93.56 TRINITY_DN1449_c0_g1_i1:562-1680(+)